MNSGKLNDLSDVSIRGLFVEEANLGLFGRASWRRMYVGPGTLCDLADSFHMTRDVYTLPGGYAYRVRMRPGLKWGEYETEGAPEPQYG